MLVASFNSLELNFPLSPLLPGNIDEVRGSRFEI